MDAGFRGDYPVRAGAVGRLTFISKRHAIPFNTQSILVSRASLVQVGQRCPKCTQTGEGLTKLWTSIFALRCGVFGSTPRRRADLSAPLEPPC